jgi:malonyl-CoA decarboxylase
MTWLLSKLASQTVLSEGDMSQAVAEGSGSTFYENILKPDEEEALMSLPK